MTLTPELLAELQAVDSDWRLIPCDGLKRPVNPASGELQTDWSHHTYDADALIVGGGAMETGAAFREWFIGEIRAGMPPQRDEQAGIAIHVMPSGDSAGARGAAIDAARMVREREAQTS